jgi:hypothetical protein
VEEGSDLTPQNKKHRIPDPVFLCLLAAAFRKSAGKYKICGRPPQILYKKKRGKMKKKKNEVLSIYIVIHKCE